MVLPRKVCAFPPQPASREECGDEWCALGNSHSLTHIHSLSLTTQQSTAIHLCCTLCVLVQLRKKSLSGEDMDSFVLKVRSLTRRSSVECRVDGWLFFVEFELDINLAHTFIDHNFDY